MNQQRYRLVFNRHRGQLMAVSETAAAQGGPAAQRRDGPSPGSAPTGLGGLITRGALSGMLGLSLWGGMGHAAQAQVVANPNAPGTQRPTVLSGPNQTPIINIQTPSRSGVSRNSYSQFDVSGNGAVLNNSRTGAQTKLAGSVPANPWLATGAARVIVNEVSSNAETKLNGYLEIGGERADLVIANPAGIAVSGGFINAAGVTLTTGTPQYASDGAITGFQVQGGRVSIHGQGMDALDANYARILARAVQVNAGVWARDLTLVTGVNSVSADGATVIPGAAAPSETKPAFALDVAQLGGIYAGRIWLIGTEAGVGSTNAGMVGTTSGDLVLSANGQLSNLGTMQAGRNIQATVQGDLFNGGTVWAAADSSIAATGALSNSGTIAARGNNAISARSIGNPGTGQLVAGVNADGSLASTGDLSVHATQALAANGLSLAAGTLRLTGGYVDVSNSQTSGGNVELNASNSIDTSHAMVRTWSEGGTLSVRARPNGAQGLTNFGGTLSAGQVTIDVGRLDNAGSIQAMQGLSVSALADVNNAGTLYAGGSTTVNAGAALTNSGAIASLRHTVIAAQRIASSAGSLLGAGLRADSGWSESGDLDVTASQGLSANGQSVAAGSLNFTGATLDISSSQTLGANLALTATSGNVRTANAQVLGLGATGAISVAANASRGQTLDNSAGTLAASRVTLLAGDIRNAGGTVRGSAVELTSVDLDNNGGTIAGDKLVATIAGSITNAQGQIYGARQLSLNAGTLTNDEGPR